MSDNYVNGLKRSYMHKMFNILSHKENTNYSYFEIPCYSNHNVYGQKKPTNYNIILDLGKEKLLFTAADRVKQYRQYGDF